MTLLPTAAIAETAGRSIGRTQPTIMGKAFDLARLSEADAYFSRSRTGISDALRTLRSQDRAAGTVLTRHDVDAALRPHANVLLVDQAAANEASAALAKLSNLDEPGKRWVADLRSGTRSASAATAVLQDMEANGVLITKDVMQGALSRHSPEIYRGAINANQFTSFRNITDDAYNWIQYQRNSRAGGGALRGAPV